MIEREEKTMQINSMFGTATLMFIGACGFFVVRTRQYWCFAAGETEKVPPPIGIDRNNMEKSRRVAKFVGWLSLLSAIFSGVFAVWSLTLTIT